MAFSLGQRSFVAYVAFVRAVLSGDLEPKVRTGKTLLYSVQSISIRPGFG